MQNSLTQFLKVTQTKEEHGKDYPRLKNLLGLSYITLLKSIADGDHSQINQICEKNLYKALVKGMSDLNLDMK